MLKRFTELSDKVYTYDYFEMFVSCLTPAPVLRRHAADFPLFKEWGLFGFSMSDVLRPIWNSVSRPDISWPA